MRHGSLFSGVGGFDLASEWMGWENVFHCEWNEFGQKVLNYYWPKAISYHDITKTDFSIHRGTIDIITGGFPCQPYSMAGKRLGKEDERHLWPEMLRAIREIQPTWVVGENVLGLVNWDGGLVFHEVQAELESQGYEVQPYVFPAASVNAPHRRDRVWFVAYSDHKGRSSRPGQVQGENGEVSEWNNDAKSSNTSIQSTTPDSKLERLQGQRREWEGCSEHRSNEGIFIGSEDKFFFTDSKCIGLELGIRDQQIQKEKTNESGKWNKSTISTQTIGGRFKPNWDNFPTVSPICTRDDGISDRLDSITFPKWRNESIKAGGNAIVPQVVYQIFKAIDKYNQLNNQLTL